jgi:MalT-like TPR region
LPAAATAQSRTRSVIEIQPLALTASSEEDAAVDLLVQALTLACAQGYARVFTDEGSPMSSLITRLAASLRCWPRLLSR